MKQRLILFATLTLIVPVSALAGSASSETGHSGDAMARFNELDQNGDGSISQAEAVKNPQVMQRWSHADSNQDGRLDQAEFSAIDTQRGSSTDHRDPARESDSVQTSNHHPEKGTRGEH